MSPMSRPNDGIDVMNHIRKKNNLSANCLLCDTATTSFAKATPLKHFLNATLGVTLVEMLVATTIFITLMSSLVLLFTGTVRTMRTANLSMEVHETGRAAFEVLERDIYAGFASREKGLETSFYGAPFGFMFVGSDERGRLGRISYVLHPDADSVMFDSVLTEPWAVVLNRVRAQAAQYAIEAGITPDAFVRDIEAVFINSYPMPVTGIEPMMEPVEFQVNVDTWSLVRFEEDLDDINTYYLPNSVVTEPFIEWPYIDPFDAGRDRDSGLESTSLLYSELATAANLLRNVTGLPANAFQVLRPAMTEQIVSSKNSEMWIRMLAGENFGPVPFWDYDPPRQINPSWRRPNINEYVLAEGIVRRMILLNPGTGEPLLLTAGVPMDALNVNGIFRYGFADITGEQRNLMPYFNDVRNIRSMNFIFNFVPPPYDPLVNTNFTVPGINFELLLRTYGENAPLGVLELFDEELAVQFSQSRTVSHLVGNPLLPRMPALVEIEFYLARERVGGASQADFRRLFSRVIEVPAGAGRDLPLNIIPKPGVS